LGAQRCLRARPLRRRAFTVISSKYVDLIRLFGPAVEIVWWHNSSFWRRSKNCPATRPFQIIAQRICSTGPCAEHACVNAFLHIFLTSRKFIEERDGERLYRVQVCEIELAHENLAAVRERGLARGGGGGGGAALRKVRLDVAFGSFAPLHGPASEHNGGPVLGNAPSRLEADTRVRSRNDGHLGRCVLHRMWAS